jgi:hypothetical protein
MVNQCNDFSIFVSRITMIFQPYNDVYTIIMECIIVPIICFKDNKWFSNRDNDVYVLVSRCVIIILFVFVIQEYISFFYCVLYLKIYRSCLRRSLSKFYLTNFFFLSHVINAYINDRILQC